jgi:hypothetical protein
MPICCDTYISQQKLCTQHFLHFSYKYIGRDIFTIPSEAWQPFSYRRLYCFHVKPKLSLEYVLYWEAEKSFLSMVLAEKFS